MSETKHTRGALADEIIRDAAPVMLEALEEMVRIYGDMEDGNGEVPFEITQARSAIAKAKGE